MSNVIFQCTECDQTYPTLDAAAKCHWGIGGVIELGEVWTVTLSRDGTVERTLTFDGRNAKFRAESYARDRAKDGAFDTPIIPMLLARP